MTLANGCLGALAVMYMLTDFAMDSGGMSYDGVAYFIGAALLLDVLDGWTARKLGVDGPMGVQLDSLADVISFGLVPTVIAMNIMLEFSWGWPILVPIIILAGSIYRLAKFNITGSDTKGFLGIPTPLNTMFWLGLWAYTGSPDNLVTSLPSMNGGLLIIGLAILSVWGMNSSIPVFSLKDMKPQWQDNWLRILWVLATLYFLFTWGLAGLTFAVPLLLLFSTIEKRFA